MANSNISNHAAYQDPGSIPAGKGITMSILNPLTLLLLYVTVGIHLSPLYANNSTSVFHVGNQSDGDHQYSNFREPVVVRTNSGKTVVGVHAGNRLAWPERSGQDLAIRISPDNGKSWGPIVVAAEHGNFSCQCHGLVYDSIQDRLLFLYTTYNWDFRDVGKGRGKKFTAPIYEKLVADQTPFVTSYLVYSDDDGKSWSEPRDITEMVGRQAHFGASEGRQISQGKNKGRLLIPGSLMDLDEKGNITRKHLCVWMSDNHGQTWRRAKIPTPSEVDSPRNNSSEARVTELSSGILLYNERTRSTGRRLSWSKDQGETWSETRRADDLKATQCNGSMLTLRDVKGELTETVLFSVPSPGGRSNGLLYVSRDGGKTWPIAKPTVEGNFAYSALIQLTLDSIGLFYESSHYKEIRFVELSVASLTEPTKLKEQQAKKGGTE